MHLVNDAHLGCLASPVSCLHPSHHLQFPLSQRVHLCALPLPASLRPPPRAPSQRPVGRAAARGRRRGVAPGPGRGHPWARGGHGHLGPDRTRPLARRARRRQAGLRLAEGRAERRGLPEGGRADGVLLPEAPQRRAVRGGEPRAPGRVLALDRVSFFLPRFFVSPLSLRALSLLLFLSCSNLTIRKKSKK